MFNEGSFNSKHNVYYVDGAVVKDVNEFTRSLASDKLIEKLDKRTGDRRYYDRESRKWLKKK